MNIFFSRKQIVNNPNKTGKIKEQNQPTKICASCDLARHALGQSVCQYVGLRDLYFWALSSFLLPSLSVSLHIFMAFVLIKVWDEMMWILDSFEKKSDQQTDKQKVRSVECRPTNISLDTTTCTQMRASEHMSAQNPSSTHRKRREKKLQKRNGKYNKTEMKKRKRKRSIRESAAWIIIVFLYSMQLTIHGCGTIVNV